MTCNFKRNNCKAVYPIKMHCVRDTTCTSVHVVRVQDYGIRTSVHHRGVKVEFVMQQS